MATEPWDVVVVGAGPAGSTAARSAAEHGARVLLIDKSHFPRYKTCGGGLIGQSLKHIPPNSVCTIESNVHTVRFSRGGKVSGTRTEDVPFLATTNREVFDNALVEDAVAAGAEFVPARKLVDLEENGNVVRLKTDAGVIEAKVVIGADGCGGRVGRFVGTRAARTDLGLEYELPYNDSSWRDIVHLDWGKRPGSYAWVFPKADILTVGVIQKKGKAAETRAYLDEWMRFMNLSLSPDARFSGHLTQWRSSNSPLRRGRIILAGETAGLLEPWTREGISFALRSGRFAGIRAAAASTSADPTIELHAYVADVNRDLIPEIEAGRKLLGLFERHGALVNLGISKVDRVSHFFVKYCRGDSRFATSIPGWALNLSSRALGADIGSQ